MINLWINIMHRCMNIDIEMSNHMISMENKWNLYIDEKLHDVMNRYVTIHTYLFEIMKHPDKRITLWLSHVRNPFYSDQTHSEWLDMYCKTQRTYFAFSKFAQRWKIKHAPVGVTTDLCMNVLNPKSRNTVHIYQDGAVYYFSLNDLVHICTTALTNSSDFFLESQCPRNPYTNRPFSKAILLKIYIAMRYSNVRFSDVLYYFYRSSFDIPTLMNKYKIELRNEYIDHFCKHGDLDEQLSYIYDMLSTYNDDLYERFWEHDTFPKKVLAQAMNPFLWFFIRYNYTRYINQTELDDHLKRELDVFFRQNYTLGLSIIVKNPNSFKKGCCKTELITHYKPHVIRMNMLVSREIPIMYELSDDSSETDDDSIS